MNHPDLREFVDAPGPFLTVVIPTPSRLDDAAHRYDVNWKNAVSRLGEHWPPEEIAELDAMMSAAPHGSGEAVVVLHRRSGPTILEFIDDPIDTEIVDEAELPRLATVIESRQRSLAHVVVEADRAGADLTAFDGGSVLAAESVEGERLHIHRGHPGGWSQRRFQQRAENTWEDNARLVADAVSDLAGRVDASFVAVAGEVRAQSLLVGELVDRHQMPDVVAIEAGSPEGIADEVVRVAADRVARRMTDLAEQVRAGLADERATVTVDATLEALGTGRVDTLLVHSDADGDDLVLDSEFVGIPPGVRVVDAAIVAALRSGADVVAVPNLAVMDGPLAATLRW